MSENQKEIEILTNEKYFSKAWDIVNTEVDIDLVDQGSFEAASILEYRAEEELEEDEFSELCDAVKELNYERSYDLERQVETYVFPDLKIIVNIFNVTKDIHAERIYEVNLDNPHKFKFLLELESYTQDEIDEYISKLYNYKNYFEAYYIWNEKIQGMIEPDVQYIKEKSEQGIPGASCCLGYLYEYGLFGLEKDYSKAFNLYQKAAQQVYPKAFCFLGYCYEFGYGTEIDYSKALQSYQTATELGDILAESKYKELEYLKSKEYKTKIQNDKILIEKMTKIAHENNCKMEIIYHFVTHGYIEGEEVRELVEDKRNYKDFIHLMNRYERECGYVLRRFDDNDDVDDPDYHITDAEIISSTWLPSECRVFYTEDGGKLPEDILDEVFYVELTEEIFNMIDFVDYEQG